MLSLLRAQVQSLGQGTNILQVSLSKKKCTLQILEQLLKEKGKKKSVTNNPIMKIKCNHKKYSVKKKARKNNGAKQ